MAEVLITLGIIGVVAAMTLPTVITNYQKKQTVNQLKKVYSVLNQAFRMSEAINGEFSGWEKKNDIGATAFYEKYFAPYLNGSKICLTYQECGYSENYPWQTLAGTRKDSVGVVDNTTDNRISFYLNDGTFVSMSNYVYIDLNGFKKPNIYGKDFFKFVLNERGIQPNGTRSQDFILQKCNKSTGDGATCAERLILYDNWEIKDDYPW